MTFGQRLRELRTSKKITQTELGKILGVSKVSISGYENDTREPDQQALKTLSRYFDVSIDYLLGNTDKRHYYSLTKKDYRDVDQMLEDAMAGVTGKAGVNYFKNGSELTETDRRLLEASLRQTMILSKELAKKKFTPKKYRGSEKDNPAERK